MSAPSMSNDQLLESSSVDLARDAYFSGELAPADEFPTAERAPPVRTVTTPPERDVTRQEILHQTLRMEMLLSLWRLESGEAESMGHGQSEVAAAHESSPTSPAPATDESYVAEVAKQILGNQAA